MDPLGFLSNIWGKIQSPTPFIVVGIAWTFFAPANLTWIGYISVVIGISMLIDSSLKWLREKIINNNEKNQVFKKLDEQNKIRAREIKAQIINLNEEDKEILEMLYNEEQGYFENQRKIRDIRRYSAYKNTSLLRRNFKVSIERYEQYIAGFDEDKNIITIHHYYYQVMKDIFKDGDQTKDQTNKKPEENSIAS